jgi:hypothetical protein
MGSIPRPRRRETRSDLVHLRSLLSEQPATSTGRVTWAWSEIEAGLERGMKLREVWESRKVGWVGNSIPPIPRLRLATEAKASRVVDRDESTAAIERFETEPLPY